MAPVRNGRLLFNKVPQEFPIPGETTVYNDSELIDLENILLNGGILVKTLHLSVDPYFRLRMQGVDGRSYSPSFTLGKP
jgi:NADPH-dependent curcumin reductase CurA